ncbi:MAG: ComEC/Rec2 family competence protein [Acidobacteria bacterium]|nr:ComEC/Rec2 family competence protein [Acidobacteriota bacterium]
MPTDRRASNFNRNAVLWLAGAFAVGILTANFAGVDLRAAVGASVVFAVLAYVFKTQQFATLLIFTAFAFAGAASLNIEKSGVAADRLRLLYDNGTIKSGEPVEIEGVMVRGREPTVDGDLITFRAETLRIRNEDLKVSGKVRLFVQNGKNPFEISKLGSETPEAEFDISAAEPTSLLVGPKPSDLKYGSRIRVSTKLEREDNFLNPGVISRLQMLDRLEIDASGSVKSGLLIEHLADESVFVPLAWVYDQREKLIDSFRRNLSQRAAGVMIASLLGDKYFLDKETADLFRDGGTFHILVISGLHITFIGGMLLLIIRRVSRNRPAQFVLTNGVLWAYTLAVGADVPVVRAAVMFTVISFSHVIYRQSSLLNSLGVCALMLLVWRPTELFDPSFQLTFVSVAAIVACAYPLIEMLRKIGRWTPTAAMPFPPDVPKRLARLCETLYWNSDEWRIEAKSYVWTARLSKSPYLSGKIIGGGQRAIRYLFEGILVSLIVQIWMLPLTVVYFHRVSIASVVLNLWVGVFIAIESFAAVIGAVISYFGDALARPFFAAAEISDWLMLALPRMFSDNGWASFRLPAYSAAGAFVYFLYFVPIIFLAVLLSRWKPFELKADSRILGRRLLVPAFAAFVVLSFAIVFHPFSSPTADGRLHVDFLDVGQGDAALVTFPDGRTLLVDGGGKMNYRSDDDGEEPFVRDVRDIGEAVVSEYLWHRGFSRIDHILATHADADHIQGLTDVAKNFAIGSAIFGRMSAEDPDHAELADVLRRRGISATNIYRGDVLHFGEVIVEVLYPPEADESNLRSENNNSVVLRIIFGNRKFLLTGDIEHIAESALTAADLSADLVKVPHHGSRTSSTQSFIDTVRANYAVVSVGRTSPFGHPHADVVGRWKAGGAQVLVTGERGTISVSTNGVDLEVKRFLSE